VQKPSPNSNSRWSLSLEKQGGPCHRAPPGSCRLLLPPSSLAPPSYFLIPPLPVVEGGQSVPFPGNLAPLPKMPFLLCPRPPLLQPRLGRLPRRLLQTLFYTKELGRGRDPVSDVWRAFGQHQHAGGTGLHQQWAGAYSGRDPRTLTRAH
jgi:hypothetical protein